MDLDAPVTLASAGLGMTIGTGGILLVRGIGLYRQYGIPVALRLAVAGGVLSVLSIALLICLTVYQ